MAANILSRLGLLLVLASLVSCQHDPYWSEYAHTRPDKVALVGKYTLDSLSVGTPEERKRLEPSDDEPSRHTLELRSDGTFRAREFPVWIDRASEDYQLTDLDDVRGRWSIDTWGSSSRGPIWGVRFDPLLGEGAAIGGSQGAYELIFRYGDPDSGYGVTYRRPDVSYAQHDRDVAVRGVAKGIISAIAMVVLFVGLCLAALVALAVCFAVVVAVLIAVAAIVLVVAIVVAACVALAIAVGLFALIACGGVVVLGALGIVAIAAAVTRKKS